MIRNFTDGGANILNDHCEACFLVLQAFLGVQGEVFGPGHSALLMRSWEMFQVIKITWGLHEISSQ